MINSIEELRGSVKIVGDRGTVFLPITTSSTLLGFDRDLLCLDQGNGNLHLFTEDGTWIRQCYLDPNRNLIRSYANGSIYFRDTRLGINYRLVALTEQRHQLA